MTLAELILPAGSAFIITFLLTPVVRNFLVKKQIGIAIPRKRDVHTKPIPRLGGIAVVASFLIVVGVILATTPNSLKFVDETFLGIDRNLFGVLLGIVILLGAGIYDDTKGMNAWVKLGFQILAALMVVFFGVEIKWVANPLGGLDIILGSWTYLLVPLWLLMMINVMNFFDGLDGLTSGLSVIASVAIIFLSLNPVVNQPATALLAAIVAGAAIGFLPHNWNPASIILGDSGSMFLGFMVGVFAIISGAKFATAALVLGIPIFDAIWVVGRRLVTGQPLFEADKLHLHHRFLAAGFHPRTAVLILYSIAGVFAMIALVTSTEGKVAAIGAIAGLMVLLGVALVLRARGRRSGETKSS